MMVRTIAIGLFAVVAWAVGPVGAESPAGSEDPIPTTLMEYVAKPDPSFAWNVRSKTETSLGRVWDVELTSQTWQGIVWKHDLIVGEPATVKTPKHMLLLIAGGSIHKRAKPEEALMLANVLQARVAVLHQVPNQPLLDNRKEDDLVTETWLKYLATGDVTWVLQLPMTKSAVKAMDALEALAKQEWNGPIDGFLVTGVSKRGWTTWLTAVADKRPIAIAPMVIDMLNMSAQMKYQLETWGEFSEQIKDYTSKNLVNLKEESPQTTVLRRLVDPYTYREQLTLPKLLIHGTNDPYWVVDAASLYWDGLTEPKYLHEVPNAGHGLEKNRQQAIATLAAFFHHVALGTPWPTLKWSHTETDRDLVLHVWPSEKPAAARLWTASSPTKDLRKSEWTSRPMEETDGVLGARLAKPSEGHVALYGELEFTVDGSTFSVCTLVRRY